MVRSTVIEMTEAVMCWRHVLISGSHYKVLYSTFSFSEGKALIVSDRAKLFSLLSFYGIGDLKRRERERLFDI